MLSHGYPLRFSGQDVERGTFSHRHVVVADQTNGQKYCLMNNFVK